MTLFRNAWPLLVALVSCASCATTAPAPSTDHQAMEATATGDLLVDFSCANGESLRVRFRKDPDVAVLVRNGESVELPQQRSGSGFIYSNGPNTIRGKGDALTVEIGRRVPIQCRAM